MIPSLWKLGIGIETPSLPCNQTIGREEQHKFKDSLWYNLPYWNASAIKRESSLLWSVLHPQWVAAWSGTLCVTQCSKHLNKRMGFFGPEVCKILTFESISAGKGLWFLILHLLGSELKDFYIKAFGFLGVGNSLQPPWLLASSDLSSETPSPE